MGRTKTQLMLTQSQMRREEYPSSSSPFFVSTSASGYAAATDSSPLFAIDCEMCRTASSFGPDFETIVLTSISIVDEDLRCVYQSLVKPPEPIHDYRTPWSGITKEMLQGVTTTLEDVQRFELTFDFMSIFPYILASPALVRVVDLDEFIS